MRAQLRGVRGAPSARPERLARQSSRKRTDVRRVRSLATEPADGAAADDLSSTARNIRARAAKGIHRGVLHDAGGGSRSARSDVGENHVTQEPVQWAAT